MIKKAMVLAAGLGTRLRPLTEHYPKPLVPIANEPLLGIHLRQLAALGVEEVMVNLHYKADQIQSHLGDGSAYGLKLHYSLEQPEILGTGGGLAQVASFFEGEDAFYFINGDILHDIDLQEALAAHQHNNAVATLLLRPHPKDGKTGWIGVDPGLRVKRVPEMPEGEEFERWMFTGLHILTPAIFAHLDEGQFGCVIRTGYRRMIEAGLPVFGFDTTGATWLDIGNPTSYLEANWWRLEHHTTRLEANALSQARALGGRWLNETVHASESARLGEKIELMSHVAIGANAQIGAGAQLERCVVLPDATVEAGSQWRNAIIMTDQVIQL